MESIRVLEREHEHVIELTQCLRQMAVVAMNEKRIEPQDYHLAIRIIREYADIHHHGKEEKIIFRLMIEHMGQLGQKLIVHGMNVEHDLGRFYVSELEKSIIHYEQQQGEVEDMVYVDIIGHLLEYANLLYRHATKENEVIYPFAIRMLPQEAKEEAEKETQVFEETYRQQGEELVGLLKQLTSKYL